jgi:hypothetical protein
MPDLQQPIFIVGTVRSGTTLLAGTLGRHPDIHYAEYELTPEWCDLAGIEIGSPGGPHTHCPPLGAEEVTDEVRDRVHRGFAEIHQRGAEHPQARFLNKNPHLSNKLPFLQAIFPNARLIICCRDLRSTVLSTQMLWMRLRRTYGVTHYLPHDPDQCWQLAHPERLEGLETERVFPGGSVAVLAEYWLNTYERIDRTAGVFDRPLLARHGDVVSDPQATLDRILEHVDLSPYPMERLPRIDPARNQRWDKLLARREREELEGYIESHESRIRALRYADTSL